LLLDNTRVIPSAFVESRNDVPIRLMEDLARAVLSRVQGAPVEDVLGTVSDRGKRREFLLTLGLIVDILAGIGQVGIRENSHRHTTRWRLCRCS
jgi:hypothetical protein